MVDCNNPYDFNTVLADAKEIIDMIDEFEAWQNTIVSTWATRQRISKW